MKLACTALCVLLGTCTAIAQSPVFAQPAYPSRTVRIIGPTSPPGGADIVARSIAPQLGERLGQQVIVDNRAGARDRKSVV